MLTQLSLPMGHSIGTIEDLSDRTDLKHVSDSYEVDELKWNLGARARPYKGFYLRRNPNGVIVELYGYHSTLPGASIFAVEPEQGRTKQVEK